ncbi:protein NEN3-like [Neltuma alba]|uniref:protein NEN3-like n=1 Tax=Neltuma alba TaxID=207710 RepID=UPI0010A5569A|nr:protein NEN3-like [Prosopis alba]
MDHSEDAPPEIVFWEVETIHSTSVILELGAILVCPKTLTELQQPYSTLVRPANPFLISTALKSSTRIDRDALADAPTFADVADEVYEFLHERIWAGHNILSFECVDIKKAFSELNRSPPEPKAVIDLVPLLTETFGRRAGDMKRASLAAYFGLGQQPQRILDYVRMNLEVIKHCATVLFLESSLPDIFTANSWVSPNATPKTRSAEKSLPGRRLLSPVENQRNVSTAPIAMGSSSEGSKSKTVQHRHFDLRSLRDELDTVSNQVAAMVDEKPIPETPQKSSSSAVVLEPDEIFISRLTASLAPLYRGSQRIQLLHKGVLFQLCCSNLKIRFGINGRFQDYAGRPKLSFVVDLDPSQTLCKVLEACDGKAQKLCLESGGSTDWRPVVARKDGFSNYPTARLQ